MRLDNYLDVPSANWENRVPAGDRSTLVLAFGPSSLLDDPAAIEAITRSSGDSVVIGCSGSGGIFGPELFDDQLCITRASFEATRLELVTASVKSADDSYAIGRALAERLASAGDGAQLRGIFVLSDGLAVNGAALAAGMTAASDPDVVITGGLAGDDERFERTWVIADGKPQSGMVTAVGLYGQRIHIGHGSRGGWDRFGPERRITSSAGNVLYELDGQPALELYKQYLGERAAGLPATALLFPLAVHLPGRPPRTVTRTILGVDERDHSMTFAGDVPQGAVAQLMRANFDRIIDSAQVAAEETLAPTDRPVLAVAISCVGRRLLLGARTEDELEATATGLPEAAHLVGFYSYGEISPIAAGTCDLHNQTMTLTTFSETS